MGKTLPQTAKAPRKSKPHVAKPAAAAAAAKKKVPAQALKPAAKKAKSKTAAAPATPPRKHPVDQLTKTQMQRCGFRGGVGFLAPAVYPMLRDIEKETTRDMARGLIGLMELRGVMSVQASDMIKAAEHAGEIYYGNGRGATALVATHKKRSATVRGRHAGEGSDAASAHE